MDDAIGAAPVTADDVEAGRGADATLPSRSDVLELYFALALTRAADQRLATLEEGGRLPLAPWRPANREGGAVGAAFALRRQAGPPRDMLAPGRRAAGVMRLFGIGLTEFFRDHLEGGVGSLHGSMTELHRVDLEAGLLAPVAPLGTVVEVMSGITLAFRLRGEDRVGVVFDSARAVSTGAWHEGVVFAAARRCPLVLVVETEPTAPGARLGGTKLISFTEMGPGYGAPAVSIDGTDVPAVVDAVATAVERARAEGGIQIVEVRYPPDGSPSEESDPLLRLRRTLLERGVADAPALDDLDREAERRCHEAARRALEEAAPSVRHDPDRPLYEGVDPTRPRRTWASPEVSA